MLIDLFGYKQVADCSFTTLIRYRRDFGVSVFSGDAPEFALLYTALRINAEPFGAFIQRVEETEISELEARLAEILIRRECVKCNVPKSDITQKSGEGGEKDLDIENTVLRWATTAQVTPAALKYCSLSELLDMINNKKADTRQMATPEEIRQMFPEV